MKWPDHFPENCPPEDAETSDATVYMLVSSPISSTDFQTLIERMPNKKFPTPELHCQSCGLSVFEDIRHVERVRRRVRRLRNRVIGQGKLTPETGVIKPTHSQFGNSHRTWWIPVGVKPWEFFSLLENEEVG
jgi:hypothetical protein